MTFAEFVAGHTVALVGKAPPVGDQGDEIDGHDVVIRVAHTGHIPDGYGTRTDVAAYNWGQGRMMLDGRWDDVLAGLAWVVTKDPRHRTEVTRWRAMRRPSGFGRLGANQVPGALYDLTHFAPAAVTVYGADFYLSAWDDEHAAKMNSDPLRAVRALFAHDPQRQRQFTRDLADAHPWITGDARFVRALTMTDSEYMEAIAARWGVPA